MDYKIHSNYIGYKKGETAGPEGFAVFLFGYSDEESIVEKIALLYQLL